MKKKLVKPQKSEVSYNKMLHLFGNKECQVTYSGNCVPGCGCSVIGSASVF